MKKPMLLPVLVVVACGGARAPEPQTPSTESASAPIGTGAPATAAAAPPAASPPPAATPASAATAAASAKPELVATPEAQLKKIVKNDLSAASSLGKEGDDWEATFAKVKAKLGTQTFISHAAADASVGDAYYWSAVRADGACDQLLVMTTKDGKKVDLIKIKAVGKSESILPQHGGPAVNACTGQPRK